RRCADPPARAGSRRRLQLGRGRSPHRSRLGTCAYEATARASSPHGPRARSSRVQAMPAKYDTTRVAGCGSVIAVDEAVGDVRRVAADAEALDQLVVDDLRHARDIAGLLALADAVGDTVAAELIEDERVVRCRPVERDLHAGHLPPLVHVVAGRSRGGANVGTITSNSPGSRPAR